MHSLQGKNTFNAFPKWMNPPFVLALLFFCNPIFAGTFTAGEGTLTLDLDVANQLVSVVSNGTTYTFTLSGGATNTWTSSTSTNVSFTDSVLTVTPTKRNTFGNINFTDSQTGNAVTFNTSGTNVFANNFIITLDNTPGVVTFNGTTHFSDSNAIHVTTSTCIKFAVASSLSTVNGNLTLDVNTQSIPNDYAFSGIKVDGATVVVTGTGVLSMRARGGVTGVNHSFVKKCLAIGMIFFTTFAFTVLVHLIQKRV